MNVKKLVLTNLPYVVLGLVCTNLGEAWRMASGGDASEKILSLFAKTARSLKREPGKRE